MNIGIIVALRDEFDISKAHLKYKEIDILNRKFYKIKYKKNTIILTYSGVGKVNSSSATSLLIANFNTDKIINIGSAGSVSKNINVSDILIVNKYYFADIDLRFFGYDLGQMSKEPKFYISSNLDIVIKTLSEFKVKKGCIATSDSFITKNNYKNFELLNSKKIDCVDMESSSIAQICGQNNVQLFTVKIISDSIFNKKCDWEKEVNVLKERILYILMKVVDAIID